MNKLEVLISLCKNSVSVEANNHRDVYESIEEYIEDSFKKRIDPDVYNTMVNTDTCIEIQFYPRTSVGFYRIYHYDLDKALDMCLEVIQELRNEGSLP